MSDSLKQLIARCRTGELPYQALVNRVPYAAFLGIQAEARGEDVSFVLPKKKATLAIQPCLRCMVVPLQVLWSNLL